MQNDNVFNSKSPSPPPGVYKELCLQVIKHKYECELQGAKQHLEVLYMHIETKLSNTQSHFEFVLFSGKMCVCYRVSGHCCLMP